MSRIHAGGNGMELSVNPQWEVHPVQVKEWLDQRQDVALLDVRQLKEWNLARIEGATLVPLNELEQGSPAAIAAMKKRRVVTYCHIGRRSLRAAALLRHEGFENVHSMAGGIDAWSVMVDPAVPRY